MTINYTTLLGLAEPVTGTESGTWGDDVNKGITDYLDIAIAGTQTISGSQTAVTLSVTNGSSAGSNIAQAGAGASGSAQYAIINCTGNPASLLTVTVPASSRQYIVINATSTTQSVKIVGAGPTTGVTIASGEKALIAWNGSDYVKVSSSGVFGAVTVTSLTDSGLTSGRVTYATTNGLLTDSTNLTFDGTSLTLGGNPTLSAGTANGVAYLNGSKVLTTGSALTFDGTSLGIGVAPSAKLDVSGASGGIVYVRGTGDAYQEIAGGGRTPGTGSLLVGQGNSGEGYLWNRFNSYLAFGLNNAEAMRLTSTGLGVGTSSPSRKLTVVSETAGLPTLGTGSGGLFLSSNNGLYGLFGGVNGSTGDTWLQAMRNDAATAYNIVLNPAGGNLGLGVTPSGWTNYKAFEIGSAGNALLGISGATVTTQNAYWQSGAWKYAANGYANRFEVGGGDGQFYWFTAPSGTAGNAITFTQAMTLDASGRLMLGVTSSNGTFTVQDGTATPSISIQGSAGTYAANLNLNTAGNQLAAINVYGPSSGLSFTVAGTERARIDSSGNLIQSTPTTPPTLSTNGTMVFNLTSNTNLRVSVRGSDGVTRTANITLA